MIKMKFAVDGISFLSTKYIYFDIKTIPDVNMQLNDVDCVIVYMQQV